MKQKIDDSELKRWTPYTHYTWSNKQLRRWYEIYGAWCTYDGVMWTPDVKKLGAGMNHIKWKRWER